MGVVTDFLDRILVRDRISMYVGANTATALYHFLSGFCEGALRAGSVDPDYDAFRQWIEARLGDSNWHRVCLLEKGMDEDQARDVFFALWDEYRATGGAI